MTYRLCIHTEDLSKYNLGTAFLIFTLAPFNFDVNKNRAFRFSLEACERPYNTQYLQKQKCVICGKTQHNRIWGKFRICEAPRANKFSQAAIYLQDEVSSKIVDFVEESSVFGAHLYYRKTCIEGTSSYLAIFVM